MSELKHDPNEPLRFRTEPPGETEECRVLVLFPGEEGELAIRITGTGRVVIISRGGLSCWPVGENAVQLRVQEPVETDPKSAVSYDKT